MLVSLYRSDIIEYLRDTTDKFHALITDPPYEIAHIEKWDSTGIAFSQELWKSIANVMLPGAMCFAFAHSRKFHRMMTVIEDTIDSDGRQGFVMYRTLFGWIYSSGIPMGYNQTSRWLDNTWAAQHGGFCGCEEPIRGEQVVNPTLYKTTTIPENPVAIVTFCASCTKPIRNITGSRTFGKTSGMKNIGGHGFGNNNVQIFTAPHCVEAYWFSDYRSGLAAFKSEIEPIVIFQRATPDGVHATAGQFGTGGINVEFVKQMRGRWPGNFYATPEILTEFDVEDYYLIASNKAILENPAIFESKPSKKERNAGAENNHPSVKPVAVGEYLCQLVLPPDMITPKKLFVPFCGSGSEIIAGLRAGFDYIVGVDSNIEYLNVTKARIESMVPGVEVIIHGI